jgi:hypothetical protein
VARHRRPAVARVGALRHPPVSPLIGCSPRRGCRGLGAADDGAKGGVSSYVLTSRERRRETASSAVKTPRGVPPSGAPSRAMPRVHALIAS